MNTTTILTSKIIFNNGQIADVPKNPRQWTKRDMELLKKSIEETPELLEIRAPIVYLYENKYIVLGGNMRYAACKALGHKHIDCFVLPQDTSTKKLKEIAIKDNSNFGQWDYDELGNNWDSLPLTDWGVPAWDTNANDSNSSGDNINSFGDNDLTDESSTNGESGEEIADFTKFLTGDRIYDSDNEFEIPNLKIEYQARSGMLLPFAAWGADSRVRKDVKTYHFYVEDYRFEALWKDPVIVLASGCEEVVEPNLSLFDATPIAYGLHQIYKKRWIARYWQEAGIRVYADLNVAKKFYKYNIMGIPKGYNAFATRGYADRLEYLKEEIEIARQISGLERPNMIVYGGGEDVKLICKANNVVYAEQFIRNRGLN